MNVTFSCIGLEFTAEVDFTPYTPAYISGPPESCYPAEGGVAEITDLKCGESDATFLLQSELREDLEDRAYDACVESLESDRQEAEEDRASDRAYDRMYA